MSTLSSDAAVGVHGIKKANDCIYSVDRQYVGTAADPYTAMSLVELLELRGYRYVRLTDATYGSGNCFCPLGAFSLYAVKAELYAAMDRAEDMALKDAVYTAYYERQRNEYGLDRQRRAEREAEWAESDRDDAEEEAGRY